MAAGADHGAVHLQNQPAGGTLTFADGVTEQTITVSVFGDTLFEADETFNVNLSGITGDAIIVDGVGVGTIINEEKPQLALGDVAIVEGNSGSAQLLFTVTRQGNGAGEATVNYATADITAAAGEDLCRDQRHAHVRRWGHAADNRRQRLRGHTL